MATGKQPALKALPRSHPSMFEQPESASSSPRPSSTQHTTSTSNTVWTKRNGSRFVELLDYPSPFEGLRPPLIDYCTSGSVPGSANTSGTELSDVPFPFPYQPGSATASGTTHSLAVSHLPGEEEPPPPPVPAAAAAPPPRRSRFQKLRDLARRLLRRKPKEKAKTWN